MREFIYYSENARTSGNFDVSNLMKAGRLDIACQIIIMSFFVSRHIRPDVKLHMIFNGPPNAPVHIEMFPGENKQFADIKGQIDISKKDVAGLIKKMLYKVKKGEKREVEKGYAVEKKSFIDLVKELMDNGKKVYVLDKKGDDVRDLKNKELGKVVFIIGDHDGIPKVEMKRLKKLGVGKISVGKQMYFASQTMTILQNEMDRREI